MDITDNKGRTTPEFRAAILAEALKQVAQNPLPMLATGIESAIQRQLGVSEQQSAQEIHSALFLLARTGLIQSTGYRLDGENESHTIGAETTITASKQLLQYAWDEQTSVWSAE